MIVLLAIVAMNWGGRALLVRGVPQRLRPRLFGLGAPSLMAVTAVVFDRATACIFWTALVAMSLEWRSLDDARTL